MELLTVPAAETVAGRRNGTTEVFSSADPWPTRMVNDGIGLLMATIALIQGVIEARQWLDKPVNKGEAATILSGRHRVKVPEAVLSRSLRGGDKVGTSAQPGGPTRGWDPGTGAAPTTLSRVSGAASQADGEEEIEPCDYLSARQPTCPAAVRMTREQQRPMRRS